MTRTESTYSDRYTLEKRWSSAGQRRCFIARDHRLQRPVLLWSFDVQEHDLQDSDLLKLVKVSARLSHPVYLQVLDAILDPASITAVLEAPVGEALTREYYLSLKLPAYATIHLILQIGSALEQAIDLGISPETIPLTQIYWDKTVGVRLDPIGAFTASRPRHAQPAGVVWLLSDLLVSLLPGLSIEDTRSIGIGENKGYYSPLDPQLGPFLKYWRGRGIDCPNDMLPAFLSNLRSIADSEKAAHSEYSGALPVGAEATTPLPVNLLNGKGAQSKIPDLSVPSQAKRPLTAEMPVLAPKSVNGALGTSMLMLALTIFVIGGMLLGVFAMGGFNEMTSLASGQEPQTTVTPVPADRAVLELKAKGDTQVIVSVDRRPAFSGIIKAGETMSWNGGSWVQVRTNNGKNLLISVNGHALGTLSEAVGHPEWNAVDWGWSVGWKP